MNDKAEFQHLLDARGLRCPEPIMLLHNVVRDAAKGELIKILATDPSSEGDVAKFCRFLGHSLLEFEKGNGEFVFLIRKER